MTTRSPPGTWQGVECRVAGCDGPVIARGWCQAHYQRWEKFGDPCIISQPPTRLGISCTVCDHPSGDQPSLPLLEAARVLGVAKNSIVKHRRGNHDNDPEWHARRAAWWIGELAALTGPVDNPPAEVHEVSEGEPEGWSE